MSFPDHNHGRRFTLDPATFTAMCGLVLSQWDTLTWRHSGLGVLQAYLIEGKTDELRVHVWDPNLKRPGIEESGLDHDHRFNMTSHVLVGHLHQTEYQLDPDIHQGSHVLWEVVHAREAEKSKSDDGKMRLCCFPDGAPFRYQPKSLTSILHAGNVYTFPKRVFHRTNIHALAVTLIQKTDQEGAPARIMAPYGKPVVHAFADPLPRDAFEPTLAQAQTKLTSAFLRGYL